MYKHNAGLNTKYERPLHNLNLSPPIRQGGRRMTNFGVMQSLLLRMKSGIKVGTKIEFIEVNGKIKLFSLTEEIVDKNIGFLGTKGKLLRKLSGEKETEKKL